MTTLRPCGRVLTQQYRHNAFPYSIQVRHYAQKRSSPPRIPRLGTSHSSTISQKTPGTSNSSSSSDGSDYAKSALLAISNDTISSSDNINPPASTRPPPLNLPIRQPNTNVITHYFHLGRAYGRFYKDGIRAIWYNRKACALLAARPNIAGRKTGTLIEEGRISRAEYQLMKRYAHDFTKLPLFGILVVIFGEWLPLLVPFIPYAVPGTCRIPGQIEGMRKYVEERRNRVFRKGVNVPTQKQREYWEKQIREMEGQERWKMAYDRKYRKKVLGSLDKDQFGHISSTLNLHGRFWDSVEIVPRMLLASRAQRRLSDITADDRLLLKHPTPARSLDPDELRIACELRGIDVLGRTDDYLREVLARWLRLQKEDEGRGFAVMEMLLSRPNTWDGIPRARRSRTK